MIDGSAGDISYSGVPIDNHQFAVVDIQKLVKVLFDYAAAANLGLIRGLAGMPGMVTLAAVQRTLHESGSHLGSATSATQSHAPCGSRLKIKVASAGTSPRTWQVR